MKKKEASMFIGDFVGVLDECYNRAEENSAENGDATTDLFLPGTFNKENSGRYVGISGPCWGDWNEEERSNGEEDDLTQPPALMENYEEDYSSDEESLLSLEDAEQKEKEDYAMDESFFDYFGEHDVIMVGYGYKDNL